MQFPDELLHDSVPVFQAIRKQLPDNVELYVMADTTFGRYARSLARKPSTLSQALHSPHR